MGEGGIKIGQKNPTSFMDGPRDEKRQNVLEDNGDIFLWFLLNNDQFSVNPRM